MTGEQRGLKLGNIIQILPTKSIMAVYIQTFLSFGICPSNDNAVTGFHVRIVDICLIQVVISHCCCKLTRVSSVN